MNVAQRRARQLEIIASPAWQATPEAFGVRWQIGLDPLPQALPKFQARRIRSETPPQRDAEITRLRRLLAAHPPKPDASLTERLSRQLLRQSLEIKILNERMKQLEDK